MVACASASINNNNICIWSTLSYTALVSLQVLSAPCCMVWSRDETLLIIGAGDGSISVWEVASGLQHAALVCPEAAPISEIKVSSDARFLAAVVNTSTACVHVFNLHPEQLLASLVFKGSTSQLQWSADGRTLRDAQGDVWNFY
jgi:WD40 repeat protein